MKFKNSADDFVEFAHLDPTHWCAKLATNNNKLLLAANVKDKFSVNLALQFNWFSQS